MASDPNLQVLGAAYIQHKCYSDAAAKKQVSGRGPRAPRPGPLLAASAPTGDRGPQSRPCSEGGGAGDPHTSARPCVVVRAHLCAPARRPHSRTRARAASHAHPCADTRLPVRRPAAFRRCPGW